MVFVQHTHLHQSNPRQLSKTKQDEVETFNVMGLSPQTNASRGSQWPEEATFPESLLVMHQHSPWQTIVYSFSLRVIASVWLLESTWV